MLSLQDKKFISKLKKLALKSRCLRAQIAAILVDKKGKIISASCNDPHACYDCRKIGCIRDIMNIPSGTQREICYGLCAEQYAISFAAKYGKSTKGATLYVTAHPCRICESLIAEAEIKKVIYCEGYPDVLPKWDVLKDYGVKVIKAGHKHSKKNTCKKGSTTCD